MRGRAGLCSDIDNEERKIKRKTFEINVHHFTTKLTTKTLTITITTISLS